MGIKSFVNIIAFVMTLYVVAVIIIWSIYRSNRTSCENNEHPLCYTFVCPNGSPAFRIDGNGDTQLSGEGLIPPS